MKSAWKPWKDIMDEGGSILNRKILIRFDDGHIEDATVHLNTTADKPYYVLFDGESLKAEPVEWAEIPS